MLKFPSIRTLGALWPKVLAFVVAGGVFALVLCEAVHGDCCRHLARHIVDGCGVGAVVGMLVVLSRLQTDPRDPPSTGEAVAQIAHDAKLGMVHGLLLGVAVAGVRMLAG